MSKFIYLLNSYKYWLYLLMVVVGMGLIIAGLMITNRQTKGEELIIVTPSISPNNTSSTEIKSVVVDIAGEVMAPGVYRLSSSSRVADALMAAGGLTKKANGEYVAKQLNQANLLTDGLKIYIPSIDEKDNILGESTQAKPDQQDQKISINIASLSTLDELWGVGEARAKQIIDNRPYTSIEELVTKAGMPQSILDNNPGKIGL